MKLISKNIRKSFLESNYIVKNWDLISTELYNEDDENISKENKSQHVTKFLQNTDRDTVLNHLLYLPPGSYKSIFGVAKKDLVCDLIEYLGEANDSYINSNNNNNKTQERKENFIPNFNNNQQQQIYNTKSNMWNNEISFQQLSNNDLPFEVSSKNFSPCNDNKSVSENILNKPNIYNELTYRGSNELEVNYQNHYKINHDEIEAKSITNKNIPLNKKEYNLVENVIKIDFVKDDQIDLTTNHLTVNLFIKYYLEKLKTARSSSIE